MVEPVEPRRQLRRILLVAGFVLIATVVGGWLGNLLFGDSRHPSATTLATGVGAWLGLCLAAVWSAWKNGGSKKAVTAGLVVGSLSALVLPAVAVAAAASSIGFDAYAREFWPDDLIRNNDEAIAVISSAMQTVGGTPTITNALGVRHAMRCHGDSAAARGWGQLGVLDMPAPGDPLPIQLVDLWEEWLALGFDPTRPVWDSDFSAPGKRLVFSARTSSGTSLTIGLTPFDNRPLPHSEPWTPGAVKVNFEYETACSNFT